MARRKAVFGECHLCGTHGKLSFEHVPPEAAFNDRKVLLHSIEKLISADDIAAAMEDTSGTQIKQRGMGAYTLCERCNNTTGSWYGSAYVELAHAAMPLAFDPRSRGGVFVVASIRPLNVLKQILTMFCSANAPRFAATRDGLRRFLLNREARAVPGGVRVYLGLVDGENSRVLRQAGLTGRLTLGAANPILLVSEIVFPPFALIMTVDSEFDDPRLVEISVPFGRFDYDQKAEVPLLLHAVPSTTYFPGDYRTTDEVRRDRAANDAQG
ncbi:hypothetical protein [Falsiroseomonas oryziterrae]|uniref:hypothetical protein n=1 Tax=Falsiroseomonas oryziterrae TaxID=2911368 RepID=UPI001F238CB8|nr:hypothetical protein [Roseomonas sp. NPKOSM-4]